MLAAFETATAHLPPENVHVEYFTPKEAPSTAGGFTVTLQQSGREIFVEEGKTILDMVIEAGIDIPFSCMEGTCGECETRVISGTPDHHDSCLTPRERASNEKIMICCSGAKTDSLVLDL
jgi:vanillate O-demethylase ferredoxin subunit